jgi:hypothetical protein
MNEFINLFEPKTFKPARHMGNCLMSKDPFSKGPATIFVQNDVGSANRSFDDDVIISTLSTSGHSTFEVLRDLDDQAMDCILYAAADRNMVCYDDCAKPGVLTSRLLRLMRAAHIKNDGKDLTDIYINADQPTTIEVFNWLDGVRVHPIPIERYERVLKTFLKFLQGSFASGDADVVIGVQRDAYSFVRTIPVMEEEDREASSLEKSIYFDMETQRHRSDGGLAILNNQRLILGSY